MKIDQSVKKLVVIITFLSTYVSLIAMNMSIDENKLDDIALKQGYGYKYANLRELESLCALLSNESYKLAVPIFVGIPSVNVQKFLIQFGAMDLADKWQYLIKRYFPTAEIQKNTLLTKQYPIEFLDECEILEQSIKDTFNKISNKVQSTFKFNNAFKVESQNIDALIQIIAKKKERLMVRSTGKEDTKKLANAGGNESISNIEPTSKEILLAMGNVIASYFGKKSLIQRLGANDESLFELTPFTPVLIQRMIGEKNSQQLPKCGVMFTEEPEGGISNLGIKNSFGGIKTTGITVIQVAYGHNEGVVNSLIPVDTFYVSPATTIYPIIKPKTYRMSPAVTRKLELKKNIGSLITQPALTTEAILVLKKFAHLLEKHYQGPMDVEFIVEEQEKTIYLVQARPIVHNPNLPKASYIINPNAIPQDQKIFGNAIGVAGGALRWCVGKNSVIVANTIGRALTMYQALGIQSTAIQSIIVGEMAPATSHEATTFRSEGKPVICIKEWNRIEQWLQNPETILVVSPQQGLVINWQGKEKSLDELFKSHIATHGWVSYPVPALMSVSKEFTSPALLTEKAIIALLPESVNAKQFMQTLAEKEIATPWKEYIHKLKTGTPNEVSIVLATLLYEIHNAISKKSENVILDKDTQQRVALLQQYLLSCAYQIKENAHYTQTNPEYTRRLLPIHFLETLLYQQPTPTEIVNGYSAATLIAKELAVEQKIIQELSEHNIKPDAFTIQYLKIGQVAMTPELEEQWKQFVFNFTNQADKPTKDAFAYLILNLGKLNMLPIWLHTSFAQAYKQDLPAPEVAQKLVKEYVKESEFLNQLFEKKEIIDALNISAFSDPKKFTTQWQTFTTDLLNYFLSDTEFIASFEQANKFGKLVALNIMTKFIDTFDLSIKAITGRPKDNVREIIDHFKTMLDGYAALFKKWVTLVPDGAIRYSPRSPLSAYIKYIDSILNRPILYLSGNLKASGYNVSAFTIGSGVDFTGSVIEQPETFEDVFTMIHQCLLAVLNALNLQGDIKNIELPKPSQIVQKELLTLKNEEGNLPVLIGIEFTAKNILLLYNLPLRDHSIQIILRYNKKTDAISLALNFFGDNMSNRWDLMYGTALILKFADIFNIVEIDKSEDHFKLVLRINVKSDTKSTYNNLQKLIKYSYNKWIKIFDFTDIVNLNKFFELIIKYIEKEILSTNQTERLVASTLFAGLIKDRQTLEHAIKYIEKEILSTNQIQQTVALNLLTILVKDGQAFDHAKKYIKELTFLQSPIFQLQEALLELTNALINQKQEVTQEALTITSRALESTESKIKSLGRDLLSNLLKYNLISGLGTKGEGKDFLKIRRLATVAIQAKDDFSQESGLKIIHILISQYPNNDLKPTIESLLQDKEVSENTKKELQIILSDLEGKK